MNNQIIEQRILALKTGVVSLKDKIDYLKDELEKASKDLQATYGAIQENMNWLQQLSKPVSVEELGSLLGADSIEVVPPLKQE